MKRGTPDHPKVRRLAKLLGVRHREAVGMLELLHHFTDQYAPRGDIGRFDDDEIAERVGWDGEGEDPHSLIESLLEAGLLDRHPVHRLVVHDWPDHAPEYTKKKVRGKTDGSALGWAVDDALPDTEADDSEQEDEEVRKIPENSGLPRQGKARQGRPGQGKAGQVSESGDEVAEPAAHSPPEEHPPDHSRLLNLLARLDGEPDEKRAWFDHEIPVIEAEADAGNGELTTLTVRYYRAYLRRGDREFRDWARKQATAEAKRRWDEEHLADMQAFEAEEGRDAASR